MRALLSCSMAALIGFGLATAAAPQAAHAQAFIGISVGFAPPPLPVYEQPMCPGSGYIWTPGYWSWGDEGYYWVPGTWVMAPQPGFLWTPGYWGWSGGAYVFNEGYWGPHVGFYGGVNYGFGYGGRGYDGGYWRGDRLFYNRVVNNVSNARITTVYSTTVINRATAGAVSFNGGPGGVRVRATPQELAAARETHVPATAGQLQQRHLASTLPALRASINHGRPPIAATPRPAVMKGPGRWRPAARPRQAPGGDGDPVGPAHGWADRRRDRINAAAGVRQPPGGFDARPRRDARPGRGFPRRGEPVRAPRGRPPGRRGSLRRGGAVPCRFLREADGATLSSRPTSGPTQRPAPSRRRVWRRRQGWPRPVRSRPRGWPRQSAWRRLAWPRRRGCRRRSDPLRAQRRAAAAAGARVLGSSQAPRGGGFRAGRRRASRAASGAVRSMPAAAR